MDMNRRTFLGGAALFGAALTATAAGCAPQEPARDELSKTGANDESSAPAWLGEAPAISDDECVETLDCDMLVVGAGCSGYFAACHGAEAGAKVILIEKDEIGHGIRDSGFGAVGSRYQVAHNVKIDKAEYLNDLIRYADGQVNPALHRKWLDYSHEAIDWYGDIVESIDGAQIDLEWSMPAEPTRYHMWPTGHGTNDGSELVGGIQTAVVGKVMERLDARIRDNGGDIRYLTKLERLISEQGAVVGAYASTADGMIRINASRGVVVATGGYCNNEAMMAALQPEVIATTSGWCCHATQPATGDGIKAMLWEGAQLDPTSTAMIFDRGLVSPDTAIAGPDSGGYYFTLGSQPFLKVNSKGERFINESTPYDYVSHAARRFGDHAYFMVWDANWRDDVLRFHTIGCSTIDLHEGGDQQAMGIEATAEEMEALVEQGLLVKADTLEELAAGLGIDATTFAATVARANELYDKGEDEDFGKEPFRLSAMRTAPFYGAKLGGLLLCTLHGVQVTGDFQVLGPNGDPIPGLYAIGNDMGGYYASSYPNFGAGTNAGRCATHGMLLGRALAQA
ncbi:FAD-dependent oxidoreductase [Adlercreutzia equolifaciens]|uniref:FAD-dependent oxidoreductase n=1 Tax=Adlercreutzia equolifaciens TaxID=446660 RepID=UPI0023B08E31|nr:FAD-dependent oxidoreductase [Adlercreutzia equolifaciens]MDE8701988.1 FAD-dependent oxidoreductase [Adlercreutzia equolifaciens]